MGFLHWDAAASLFCYSYTMSFFPWDAAASKKKNVVQLQVCNSNKVAPLFPPWSFYFKLLSRNTENSGLINDTGSTTFVTWSTYVYAILVFLLYSRACTEI